MRLRPAFPSRWRERGGGLLFALGFNALLLLALLTMAPKPMLLLPDARMPVTFEMAPQEKAEKAEKTERKKEEKRAEKRETAKAEPVKQPRPTPTPETVEQKPLTLPFLTLSRSQMAAADIGKMPAKPAESGSSGQGDSKAVSGPGEGPGGVQLYEAEWYRRPTHAELAGYLPSTAPGEGWGLVACRTIENYQVDNCQALGESPMGSGFARAVRQAAWQFRVLPPRVNGKVMVGSWVRIRIDYRQTVARQSESDPPGG